MKRMLILLVLVGVVLSAVPVVRVVDVSHDKMELNTQIAPKIQRMKQIADLHLDQWNALSYQQKKQLIATERYPLVNLMWSIYKYLHNNWFGEAVQHGDI